MEVLDYLANSKVGQEEQRRVYVARAVEDREEVTSYRPWGRRFVPFLLFEPTGGNAGSSSECQFSIIPGLPTIAADFQRGHLFNHPENLSHKSSKKISKFLSLFSSETYGQLLSPGGAPDTRFARFAMLRSSRSRELASENSNRSAGLCSRLFPFRGYSDGPTCDDAETGHDSDAGGCDREG